MIHRRQLLQAALCATPWVGVLAQTPFPSKPVRIIVPFGPGGVADLTARTVGQALAQAWGQPVVVDNRPGAGGMVAGELVARAEPDGHTLLLMSNATAVSAGLFRTQPFNPRTDFAPVSVLGLFDMAVVVPDHSPHKTLAALLAFGRAHPGQLNLGTIQTGSTQHLAAELFRSQAQWAVQTIPYNGTPAVLNALRGGQIDAAVAILGPLKPHIQAKSLRLLAVMGEHRAADFPGTPAVRELAGLSAFQVSSWNALAAPAKTPKALIDRLNADITRVLNTPEVAGKLAALNVQAKASTPAQLAQLLDNDIRRWTDVIQKAGIALQ